MIIGVSSHVGSARGKQDGTGAVLAHIKDLTVSHAHEQGGIGNSAYTTDKQVFHTDVGDLIALFALDNAAEGGTSRISSGPRVYNELAATRPDLIHTLAEEWPLDRFVIIVVDAQEIVSLIWSIASEEIPDIPKGRYYITRMATSSSSTHAAISLGMGSKDGVPISHLSLRRKRKHSMRFITQQRNTLSD